MIVRYRPGPLAALFAALIAVAGPLPPLSGANVTAQRGSIAHSSQAGMGALQRRHRPPLGTPKHAASTAIRPHIRPFVLPSYAYQRTITVSGGGATVSGSTTIPVPVTSTDYVVQLHLTGAQAALLYDSASYNATTTYNGVPFADVTMWYTGGGSPQQIDIDYDTATYGTWSSNNITLWFKLQAPLGAAPATDSGYVLAWGNTAPTVLRTWANLYPLADDFLGSSLDSSKWGVSGTPTTNLSNGILSITSANNTTLNGILSQATFGPGYLLSARASLPQTGTEMDFRHSGDATIGAQMLDYYGQWRLLQGYSPYTQALFGTTDGAYHTFGLARDSAGNATGFVDGTRQVLSGNAVPDALPVEAGGTSVNSVTLNVDWIKVRPWISGTEPSAAMSSGPLDGWPAAAMRTYYSASLAKHWTATGPVGGDFRYLTTVGYLLAAGGPGLQALYDCAILIYNDHFVSTSANCDGYNYVQFEGYDYVAPPPGLPSAQLYRCYNGGSLGSDDHFDTTDPACNGVPGFHAEGPQGYVLTAPVTQSGTIPWHPHHSITLSDHLSASVDLADGHLDLHAADMSIPARGLPLTVNRTWDSTLAQAGLTSTAGQGWTSDLLQGIGGVLTGTVVLTDSAGTAWPFVYGGSPTDTAPFTNYLSPPGYPWQLAATNLSTQTVGYTLTNLLSSQVITFSQQGALQGTADAYGNTNALGGAAGAPTSLANSGGRAVLLSYTGGLLADVQSPLWQNGGAASAGSQHVTYGYNGSGQLSTQTWAAGTPDALSATYGYSGTQLVTVTTPYTQATHAWTIGYDSAGRVASITSPFSGTAGQAGYTPAYTTQFGYSPGQTVVTQGAGTSAALVMTYTLDGSGEATATQDGMGDTTQTVYDADHDVLSATDGDHNTTTSYYAYVGPNGYSGPLGAQGTTGLVTETLQPPISPDYPGDTLTPISTTYSYDPSTYDLLKTVRYGFGDVTVDTYDAHHSVITTTEEVSSGPAQQQLPRRHLHPLLGGTTIDTWRFTYNQYDAYGERTAAINGNGAGETTTVDPIIPSPTFPNCTTFLACAPADTSLYTYTTAGDLQAEATPPIQSALGGVTSTVPAVTSYSYDLDGNRISSLSAIGNQVPPAQQSQYTTTYSYDHLGRLTGTTLPQVTLVDGSSTHPVESTGYDGEGHAVRQVDGNGDVTISSYDPLGRLVGTTDPVQATTLYTYSATEQAAQQDAQGNVSAFAYDAAGRLITATDPLTGTTAYGYDAAGNTIGITTGLPGSPVQVETRQYDAQNRVVTDTIGAPGGPVSSTVTSYSLDGDADQIQQPNGDVVYQSDDFVGHVVLTTLSPGLLTGGGLPPSFQKYTYDGAGNQTTATDADNRYHTAQFDGANRLLQSVDLPLVGTPITTTPGYDPDGNTISQLISQTVGGAVQTTGVYTAAVNAADWTTSTQDNGLVSAYDYDAAGQQRGQTVVQGTSPATTTLDKEGRATAIGENVAGTGPYTSTFGYLATDLPYTASLPGGLGISELNQYDAADHLLTATLAGPLIQTPGLLTSTLVLSSTYGYGYTPLGWTSATTSTVSSVMTATQMTHDPLGRLTQAAGPPGDLWLTRPTTTTRTLGGVACPTVSVCYAVGDHGVILGSTDGGATWSGQASGVTTTLNAVACPLAGTCYAVGDGGVIRMTSNGGASWSLSSSGGITTNLESVSCPTSGTCYAAGALGKILVLSGSSWSTETTNTTTALWGLSCSNATTCTAVGSLGKILGTTDGVTWSAETRPTTLQLNAVSCPTSAFCAAVGVTGTLAISTGAGSGGWTLQTSNTSQTLNGVACPSASQCEAVGAQGTLLGAADAGQLWTTQATTSTANLNAVSCADTSTCLAVGTSGTILSSSGRSGWGYDGNGNLLTSDTTGLTTTYGYASVITPNEVLTLTVPGQLNRYYGYDQNGDTTAITTSSGSLNTQLSYDSAARPITITLADGTQVTQGYNAQGQRASYTVSNGGSTSYSAQFSYRGNELGQAVIVNGAQAYTDTYLYGPQGLPLELLRQQGGATSRYFYEEDGRGNVVAVTNISGTVVDHYAYDVWGRLIAASEQVPQRLRYGGYWWDQELGWYWVSVRYYDPVLERWLQPDPSQQDGIRTYAYVGDDPVDFTDPTGLNGDSSIVSSLENHLHDVQAGLGTVQRMLRHDWGVMSQEWQAGAPEAASLARHAFAYLSVTADVLTMRLAETLNNKVFHADSFGILSSFSIAFGVGFESGASLIYNSHTGLLTKFDETGLSVGLQAKLEVDSEYNPALLVPLMVFAWGNDLSKNNDAYGGSMSAGIELSITPAIGFAASIATDGQITVLVIGLRGGLGGGLSLNGSVATKAFDVSHPVHFAPLI